VRPRSGLAAKSLITVLNTPGTIDADYRGEIKVILINHGNASFVVGNGDRIGQLVMNKIERINWKEAVRLDETDRGENGFGSTGKS
jgi:dUTP pyrophosphatase